MCAFLSDEVWGRPHLLFGSQYRRKRKFPDLLQFTVPYRRVRSASKATCTWILSMFSENDCSERTMESPPPSESSFRDKQSHQLPEGIYVLRNKMARTVLDLCKPQLMTSHAGHLTLISKGAMTKAPCAMVTRLSPTSALATRDGIFSGLPPTRLIH